LISICFSKIVGAPIGSPQFLGSKEESMACALRRYGVTDSGQGQPICELTNQAVISAFHHTHQYQRGNGTDHNTSENRG
jgi:hypothetical protein